MGILAPLFFVGLGALVVPLLIHLIQRERKEVVQFPSLMFLRRIPYQSVERRRIHNWWLFALRCAAMALLVAAFARPFFKETAAAAAVRTGAREVVILLDDSASMGYGDHWAHAQDAAHKIVAGLGGADKATLVLFSRNAEENVRATSDRGRLDVGDLRCEGRLRQHALRAGAAPRPEPALAIRAASQGGVPHQRLPEDRLGAARRDSPA